MPELLSLCEVAQLLGGVHVQTVRRWHRENGLPLKRRGARGRFFGERAKILTWYGKFLHDSRPGSPRRAA